MDKKRFHIVIASVIFAALTWLSVNMRDEYVVVKQMPVVLENMKEGKVLKYPVPKTVAVRFRGNGWSLAGLYLAPDVKYFIDVSTIGSENFMITGKDLLEHIKLPVSLQPLDVKPDTLLLALDDYREKRVPVVPRVVLEFRDGYGEVGPTRIAPESVVVGGSEYLLRPITGWPTVYRRFDELRSPLSVEIPLEESDSYSLDVAAQAVRLDADVQPFAEKPLSGIPIEAIGTPPNREVIFIPPRMDMIVRGGIDQLKNIRPSDFQATVSYEALAGDSAESVVPAINGPEEVKIVSRRPERFQFIIRKKL